MFAKPSTIYSKGLLKTTMQRFRRFLIEWGYIGIALLIVGQLLTPLWWGFTLLTPFTFIGSVLLLAIVPLIWQYQLTRRVFLSVGFLGVVWGMLPLSAWQPPLSAKTATTIISYNVNIDNADINNELRALQNSKADLLLLAEAGGQWQAAYQQLQTHYPYGCGYDENSPFALHALSRLPLLGCKVSLIADKPFIRIQLNDQRVIYFLHPPPPLNAVLAKARQHYLFDTAELLADMAFTAVVLFTY